MQIGEEKPLQSWVLPKKFISKVVYDQRLKQYVAAFSNGNLRLWNDNTIDINKTRRRKVNTLIYHLSYN